MVDRLLYRDAAERERLLDLAMRLRPAYAVALVLMAVPMIVGVGTFGVAAVVPLALVAAAGLLVRARLPHAERPERLLLGTACFGLAGTLASIALADGPRELLFAMPVVPLLGLAPVVSRRAAIVAGLLTALGIVLVGVLAAGSTVQSMPPTVILPVLLVLVTVLGSVASRNAEDVDRDTAMVDPLTGLLNRVALRARSTELQLHAGASTDRIGMLLIDIDHFAGVGTVHGRAVGDGVLASVAGRLRTELGTAGTVYRFGGEAFVVLLPSATHGSTTEWAERLREAVCFAPIDGVDVTISLGAAVSGAAGFSFRDLFVQADGALVKAAAAGGNRVRCAANWPQVGAIAVAGSTGGGASSRNEPRRATDVAPVAATPDGADHLGPLGLHLRDDAEGNWLVADAVERAHVVDLLRRSRTDSQLNSVLVLVALLLCGPWLSWWMLLPPVIAGVAWRACTTRLEGRRRPELPAFYGLLLITVSASASAVIAGPGAMFALPLGALVVLGACAAVNRAGAAVIAATAGAATVGAGFAIDAAAVLASPIVVVLPLALIAASAIVGESVGRCTRDHRLAAFTDGLTGALNRAALEARIPQLAHHVVATGAPISLAMVELDAPGVAAGASSAAVPDGAVLAEVSSRLRGSLRAFDSVYRFDEATFAIVLTDTTAADARVIAERARRVVGAGPVAGAATTISVGLATAPGGEALDFDAMVATASARLAAARRAGPGRVVDGARAIRRRRLLAA